jgi:acyl-coenzyme A synthetase/AMP-(fatty) acid ligase
MAYHFLVTILMYVRYGIPIALSKDLLADSIMTCAEESNATVMYAAPMHYRILAADKTERMMPTLTWAISTSTAIPPIIQDGFFKRFNIPITQVYGIIEAGLPMISRPDDPPETWQSVGKAAPGFEVELQGETGQLAIRGPGMYHAYLHPWQEREDGWFLTGDLATRDAQGYIMISGREKSMINVSGNKAFPEEIEAVLLTYPGIEATRVYGDAHPLMGEIVCAEVVSETAIDVETLLKHCRQKLSTYKVPQRVKFVDVIEETDSGKVKRG